MKKILVLGGGLIGKAIVADLCEEFHVAVADLNEDSLQSLKKKYRINTHLLNITDSRSLQKIAKKYDLVIGAVPGHIGYQAVETVIKAGINIVDISFFPENPFHLNRIAQENEVVAVVDCGVAPGLSNIICGYHHQFMRIENFACYVGGLPKEKKWPYEYKAPFSPIDVIEEYTRPARLIINEEEVIKEALSEIELLDFEKTGLLEAFNSDGLRTLLYTFSVNNMKEKTLRYPGHAEKMRMLRDSGFFSKETVNINGKKIRPLDLTTKMLFPLWKLEADEKEFTIMRILIEGEENGIPKKYQYDLYDEYNKKTGLSSMSRTTGFTCTAVARLVLGCDYDQKGISPPEYLGTREECFDFIMEELKRRKIGIEKKEYP